MKGCNIMELKTIVFNSELEFRKYVILNSNKSSRIIVFEDVLDNVIFFYSFIKDDLIVSTKERLNNNFSTYRKIYSNLTSKLQLCKPRFS